MMKRISFLIAAGACMALGCAKNSSNATNGDMSMADSMKSAYKAITSAWDAGNADSIGQYIADNYVEHNPEPGAPAGLAGMKQIILEMKKWFPDEKTTIDDIRVDGDVLVARVRMSGTNTGPMMGMPPTNKKMTDIMSIDMMRWENGKFVEHWGAYDDRAMMSQLGLAPAPPMPTADSSKKM